MTAPSPSPCRCRPRLWWTAASGVCAGVARAVSAWVLGLLGFDSD